MRQSGLRLAALGLGLVLAWALLESVLRTIDGGPERPRLVGVDETRVTRGPAYPHFRHSTRRRRQNERFNLLVVGDSFTWGSGIYHEDTYGRRLETLLERMNSRLDVELTLYSRPGWNTKQEYDSLRLRASRLAPDLILLGFCLNDAEPQDRVDIEGALSNARRRRPASGLSRWFYRHSHLAALAWNRLENSRQRRATDEYYQDLFDGTGWQDALTALDGLRQLAWDVEAPLVVAVFPVFDQQLGSSYSYRPLHLRVMAAMREREIVATDLLKAYRGVDATRLAVEPFTDPHPNELAHRIASQHLADFLVEQELVPVSREQRDRVELSLRPTKKARTEQ